MYELTLCKEWEIVKIGIDAFSSSYLEVGLSGIPEILAWSLSKKPLMTTW